MNEQDVRRIVREEIISNSNAGAPVVEQHDHDGNNSPQIPRTNIIHSMLGSGSITFAHTGDYVLNMFPGNNITPSLILCYGTVIDNSVPTVRVHTFGSASLGQSYYFQPGTSSAVEQGGTVQPFIQSSSYFSVSNAGTVHALTDEGHLVDVEYPVGTIHARLTLKSYTNSAIILTVDNLDADWQIICNIVVI